jgi:hypothetical protein
MQRTRKFHKEKEKKCKSLRFNTSFSYTPTISKPNTRRKEKEDYFKNRRRHEGST